MDVDEMELSAKVYQKCLTTSIISKSQHKIVLSCASPTVDELKEALLKAVDIPAGYKIELVYCGRNLKSGNLLASYRIKSGSCINVISKEELKTAPVVDAAVSKLEVEQALIKMMNPAYRSTIEAILTTTEVINDIISQSPQLQEDLVAQGILRNVNVISILAESENVDSVLDKHPCLASATLKVCDAVMERVTKHGIMPTRTRNTQYALDRMSDEEDDEPPAQTRRVQTGGTPITANALAQALAMAAGASQTPSGNQQTPPGPGAASATPTAAHSLSAALSQALASASTTPTSSTSTQNTNTQAPAPDYSSQLAQLRDMGISDQAVALQALQAAGGNVHLALEIIYGTDM